jgi:HAD superfamily hydrolase (TIGR01509 family)
MIKYVIFDKDGTLIDTEPFFYESWYTVGDKWGLPGMRENYYPNIAGKSVLISIKFLSDTFGEAFDSEGFMAERMDMVKKMLGGDINFKSGCMEILRFLREQGIKIAIATSTTEAIAKPNIKRLGLYEKIDAVVFGDEVSLGKPHPDIFLEAGRRIGAVPEETIVVGDSSFDMIGGYRAGMRPVMVIDHNPPSDEAKPLCFAVYQSLFDVIELIKRENNID